MDMCAGVRTHLGGGPQAPRQLQMCLCPGSAPMLGGRMVSERGCAGVGGRSQDPAVGCARLWAVPVSS